MQKNDAEGGFGANSSSTHGVKGVLEDTNNLRLYNKTRHVASLYGRSSNPVRLIFGGLQIVLYNYSRMDWEHLASILSLQGAATSKLLGSNYQLIRGNARPSSSCIPGYDRVLLAEVLDNPDALSARAIFNACAIWCASATLEVRDEFIQ
jgi:hypothetical protein